MKIETADGMYEEGLSLKGEINTTYWTLVDTFGEPTESGEPMLDTTVVTVRWLVAIDGVLATIYDWNTGKDKTQNLIWNIGGVTEESYWKVKEAIGYKSRQKLNMSNNINASYNAHLLHGR
tara:strand:- start:1164 stop:1526 length:363 start_codon:yes stop_codon:yes gene_type:complete